MAEESEAMIFVPGGNEQAPLETVFELVLRVRVVL
jgi:hypothetical protein